MTEAAHLQREILVTAYDSPGLTPAQIADIVGCSEERTVRTLEKFDTAAAQRARIEELNVDLGRDSGAVGFGYGLRTAHDGASSGDFGEVPTANAVRPITLLSASTVGGAVLLSLPSLFVHLSMVRWGALTLCVLGTVLVLVQFGRMAWARGFGRAVEWLLGADRPVAEPPSERVTDSAVNE